MRVSILDLARVTAAVIIFGISGQSVCAQGATYKLVAFTGEAAPGGGTFDQFLPPRIGADGTIGFIEYRSGEGCESSIYAGKPGALQLVVSTTPSSESSSQGFSDFFDLSVSKNGFIAFTALSASEELAVWSNSPDVTKGSGEGMGLSMDPSELGSVAFRSGVLALKAVLPEERQSTKGVLLMGGVNSLKAVLNEGDLLGTREIQKIYGNSESSSGVGPFVDMNESGAVALKVSVIPAALPAASPSPSPSPSPKEAIYAGDPSSPALVALQGDSAPGFADTYTYYAHLSKKPSIAANGRVAFTSTLSSYSESYVSNSAVFSGLPGAVFPLVKEGETVPTTEDITFGELSDAVVNSTGDVAFRARIWYPNETSRVGMWIKRRTGPPVLLAISGMTLPTPGGPQEATSVDFAGPGTFNDLHEFVFQASFEEGEGIYVADTRPGAPVVDIIRPARPRDRVTQEKKILVAGIASDDTGIEKIEYTVAHETAASRRKKSHKRGKKFIVSRVKFARGTESWRFRVPLTMGLNLISVTATDKLGNQSEPYKIRVLRYKSDSK